MKEVHMVMKYVCDKCGYTAHMYLEKGLEEECNTELRVKSGMPHKPVPFLIDCPECGQGLMHDKGWKGFSEFIPVSEGMNLFVNDPNEEHGIPVFNYCSWDTSSLRQFVNELFRKEFRKCEDIYIQGSGPLVQITEKDRIIECLLQYYSVIEAQELRDRNALDMLKNVQKKETTQYLRSDTDNDNPLAKYSTTQLKAELRRRKGVHNWKNKEEK